MQLFVVGPPRSGFTIITQFLNHHEDINIFDEIDLVQVNRSGGSVIGTLAAFLLDRGVYEAYRRCARETGDPALAPQAIMSEIAWPCTISGEKIPRYAMRLDILRRSFAEAAALLVLRDARDVVNSYLLHRDSHVCARTDFWIKPNAAELFRQRRPTSAFSPGNGWRQSILPARHAAALKVGNLSPRRQVPVARDRIDANDPTGSQVDALARRFGCN